MKIKTIIFDLDGTLIDSSDGIVEAFNYALQQFNLPVQPREKITPMIGFPVENMFREFTDKSILELKSAFRTKAMETVIRASQPLEGAEKAVTSLFASGFKLGIATTKIRAHIDGILEKLKWGEYFEAVIGGDEVSRVKPHPEQFEALLDKISSDCNNSAVVGDTINDILPARQLGLTEIAVRSPYGNSILVQQLKPHYFLEDIFELQDTLARINLTGDNLR
jgi:pyrophosphatase PpaX